MEYLQGMALKPSIKISYHMPYRGATQEWSNRWHFDGAVPASEADWNELGDELATDCAYLIPASGSVVRATGYLAGSEVPVHTKAYALTGTADYSSSDIPCPGDVAAIVRWTTTARTSRNHPIYLFKYFHQAMHQTGAPDTISTAYKLHLNGQLAKWTAGGYSVGGVAVTYCGPHGAVAQTKLVADYLTHRDFRR